MTQIEYNLILWI